jgi:hypothetical protein
MPINYFDINLDSVIRSNERAKAIAAADMKKRIEQRGGVLAKNAMYLGSDIRVPFICAEGHGDNISRDKLLQGGWCRKCNPGLRFSCGEELTRLAFELFFKKDFPKCRPSFLINPETGHLLEFDGYSERLKIAFEYQGTQHYKFNKYYHKTQSEFDRSKRRDEYTRRLAIENSVILVEIPQLNRGLNPDEILIYLEDICLAAGLKIRSYDPAEFKIESAFKLMTGEVKLRSIVANNGGQLLTEFLTLVNKVKIKCANENHKPWHAAPSSIIYQGTWCPRCGDESVSKIKLAKSTNEIKSWLEKNSGARIELNDNSKYLGHAIKHDFACKHGHRNKTSFVQIKQREKESLNWCIECHFPNVISKRKYKSLKISDHHLIEFESLLLELGFRATQDYSKQSTKTELVCVNDSSHKLKLNIYELRHLKNSKVSRGYIPCQFCGDRHKKTITDANYLARRLGGNFIDPDFFGVKYNHHWNFDGNIIKSTYETLKTQLNNRSNKSKDIDNITIFNYQGQIKRTISDAKFLAAYFKYEFLDDKFYGVKHYHKWLVSSETRYLTMDSLQIKKRRIESKQLMLAPNKVLS